MEKVPRRGTPTCILLRLESVVCHSEIQMHRSAAKEELDSQLASIEVLLLPSKMYGKLRNLR